MKILVLILSFKDDPYLSLMRSQQQTFGKELNENAHVLWYYGGTGGGETMTCDGTHAGWEMGYDITDSYYYMAGKFQKVLDTIHKCKFEYDYILRTNSSSYINLNKALEFSKFLPKEKCYAGAEIKTNEGFSIVSGAGFFLSRDTADILRNEIDPNFEKEEDYYCGMILNKHGIEVVNDESRFDVPSIIPPNIPLDRYHYRFKNGDRLNDAKNMLLLDRKIKNK